MGWDGTGPAQAGDEVFIVRPYSGSRIGASIRRTTVAKVTARYVVLGDGTRFTKQRIVQGKATLPGSGAWTASDMVMPTDHPDAVRYLRENDLARATSRLRDACRKVDNLAGGDPQGGRVDSESVAAIDAAYGQLVRARQRYGLAEPEPSAE